MRIYGHLRAFVAVVVPCAVAGCAVELGDESLSGTEQNVLGPPTNVTVTAVAPERVNLSWDAVPGALKYYVYQSTDMNGPFVFVNTARAPSTSIQIAHLTPGVDYCFTVRTEDGGGPGAFSTPACTMTHDLPQPPDTTIATQADATTVHVQWSSVEGTVKYYVYRSSSLDGTYSYLTTVFAPTTELANTALSENTTYCYKVAADIGGYVSVLSPGHCNTSLQPPQNVTATRTSPTRIRVDFAQAADAVKYYLYESRDGGPYANVATVLDSSAPSIIRANLTTGSQYCYRVQTVTATNQTSPRSLPPACATP